MLDNNIGYINLSTFSGNPSKEFKQAFLDLKKQGITSLVIDLRNNGGGLLDEAVGNSQLLPAARQNTGDNERKDQTGKQYVQDVA